MKYEDWPKGPVYFLKTCGEVVEVREHELSPRCWCEPVVIPVSGDEDVQAD